MTKKTIEKALRDTAGGAKFITQGDIKRCLGCGDRRVEFIVKGLDFIKFNRTKQYDASEVAASIYAYTEVCNG